MAGASKSEYIGKVRPGHPVSNAVLIESKIVFPKSPIVVFVLDNVLIIGKNEAASSSPVLAGEKQVRRSLYHG